MGEVVGVAEFSASFQTRCSFVTELSTLIEFGSWVILVFT